MGENSMSVFNYMAGRYYLTKGGARAYVERGDLVQCLLHGYIVRDGVRVTGRWKFNGKYVMDDDSSFNLATEFVPFSTWMCKVGNQPPMPAPNEEIAKKWAERCNGRAFRVMEVVE
jgi:hypothetical protein